MKTKATAGVGLGKRQLALWLLLQSLGGKLPLHCSEPTRGSTVPPPGKTGWVLLMAEQLLADCVGSGVYFPRNPLSIFRGKEKANKVKP